MAARAIRPRGRARDVRGPQLLPALRLTLAVPRRRRRRDQDRLAGRRAVRARAGGRDLDRGGGAMAPRARRRVAASREPKLNAARTILVTGMSGTGKSTALAELRKRGFEVVDTDEAGWTEWSDDEGGYVWREDRIAELLARTRERTLYVSGTVSNQVQVLSAVRRDRASERTCGGTTR